MDGNRLAWTAVVCMAQQVEATDKLSTQGRVSSAAQLQDKGVCIEGGFVGWRWQPDLEIANWKRVYLLGELAKVYHSGSLCGTRD